MKNYHDLLQHILDHGTPKGDRTGTGTRSIFGAQLRFNLAEGFPLVTTKKVSIKPVIIELLWFLRGESSVKFMQKHDVHIWDPWVDDTGPRANDLGPVYGVQWRKWETTWFEGEGIDRCPQIKERSTLAWARGLGSVRQAHLDQVDGVIQRLKTNPDCRRMLVSAWNVTDLPDMALAPCHVMWQLYAAEGRLSLHMYQRSADMFIGVPFNIASYALLTMMIAKLVDMELGDLVISYGDAHIYNNHVEQVREQLSREPRPLPTMVIKRKPASIDDYSFEDFELVGYDPHPRIKAPVAV